MNSLFLFRIRLFVTDYKEVNCGVKAFLYNSIGFKIIIRQNSVRFYGKGPGSQLSGFDLKIYGNYIYSRTSMARTPLDP